MKLRCLKHSLNNMYAVIDLHFKRTINADALVAHFPDPTPKTEALARTVYRKKPADAATAFYAQLNRDVVFLLLRNGGQLLQPHVESLLTPGSIAELKSQLEQVLAAVPDAASMSSQEIDKVGVAIYAEGMNRVKEGRYQPFREILVERFRGTIIGDILMAVAPALVGASLGLDARQAVLVFISAALAFLTWIPIEAACCRKELTYADVGFRSSVHQTPQPAPE